MTGRFLFNDSIVTDISNVPQISMKNRSIAYLHSYFILKQFTFQKHFFDHI